MHPMNWGDYPHKRYSRAGMDMDLPLIPAPIAVMTMMVGLGLGMLVGYKKASMVQMHKRMMGGGYGMMGGGHGMMSGGHGQRADWMRKKAMMQAMAAHHHHGDGGPCCCGCQDESGEMSENSRAGQASESSGL